VVGAAPSQRLYAARALFLAPDGRLRQAHTSPIYVIVDRKPIAFGKSAKYMLRWVGRLEELAKTPGRISRDADRDECCKSNEQARRFYADVVSTAFAPGMIEAGGESIGDDR